MHSAMMYASLVVALLSLSSVNGFSNHRPTSLKAAHMRSHALGVVLNPKNRGDKKVDPNFRIRRDTKNSTRKQLSSFFGFTTTAELLNGRLAMSFFLLGIYEEMKTGRSMLQQVGLINQDQQVNGFMFAALFGSMALYPSIIQWFTKLSAIRLRNTDE